MRLLAWIILSIAAVLAAPARAQTYGSTFPVCIQTYQLGGMYISCEYTSMAGCQATASGRAAQCIVNPYYAPAPAPARRYHHH
jgi:hypothetical protein